MCQRILRSIPWTKPALFARSSPVSFFEKKTRRKRCMMLAQASVPSNACFAP